MTQNLSAVKDPIYILLVRAREQLCNNFEIARLTYGDEIYSDIMERLQEEHDALKEKIDVRINNRIMQLAIEELNQ